MRQPRTPPVPRSPLLQLPETAQLGFSVRLGSVDTSGTLAWLLWLTTVVQVAFGFALAYVAGTDLVGLFGQYVVAMAAGALGFASVGLLIVRRQPRNAVGWLFCVLGPGFATGWMTEYAHIGLELSPGSLVGAALVNWVNRWLWMPLLALAVVYLPLLFPDGRLPSSRWRIIGWLAAVAAVAMSVMFAIDPGRIDASQPDVVNQFSPDWAPSVLPVLAPLATALAAMSVLGGLSAVVVRFRTSGDTQRAQLKWFLYALAVLVVAIVAPLLIGFPRATQDTLLSGVLLSIGFPAMPLATGAAILRHRLFDIDQLISRTLTYALLTACVLVVYIFTVGYLGALLHAQDSIWISLTATAIVAVIFQPLREHLQRAITHLLYGRRDEPYAVLAQLDRRLSGTLVEETVPHTIVNEIRTALRLSFASICLIEDGEEIPTAAVGLPVGEVVDIPLTYQAERVGTLRLGARAPGEPLSAADLRLVEAVARHAGAALHGVRLTAQLRRSRERLVLAREEERRRLRRDLHDELAPTLAGLGLVAASIDRLILANPTRAQEAARDLHAGIRDATGEIRRVAHDLRPPALDELGLVEALRQRVNQLSGADGAPLIRLKATSPLSSLPAAVEVAAYRIAQEALMNMLRHASARTCTLNLSIEDSSILQIVIADDGVGFTETASSAGLGLRSMRERAEELGGECAIESDPLRSNGTRVVARLPLSTESTL